MMDIIIHTPLWTQKVANVTRVSLPGTLCPFVVLKGHAPIISTISAGEIHWTPEGAGDEGVLVSGGVVRVKDDIVEICAEL